MKTVRFVVVLSVAATAAAFVPTCRAAADVEAGRAKVEAVCAACHGRNGVSVSDSIPNLAAQRAAYIEAQLKALKEGTRKNPIMSAIAAQLTAEDMANVAAWFASQPGASSGARSELLPSVARSQVGFPEAYKDTFTRYHSINFPALKQVRHYFANPVALQAARDGKPLPDGSFLLVEHYAAKLDGDKNPVVGPDGAFIPEKLLQYAAMQSGPGWGRDVPDMLKNGDWNYAIFTLDRKAKPGVNQAECFGCHKPHADTSYTFTLKELAAAKGGGRP